MAATKPDSLAAQLTKALTSSFPGLTVEIARVDRWDRPCITVRWPGFAELLPEERFHRVVKELSEELRGAALSGYIWLELAPGESIDAFLKHPRSEDVAGKEQAIHSNLKKQGFYAALSRDMGRSPKKTCAGDFSRSIAILNSGKSSSQHRRDAKLLFIRQGAYCDCQVVESVGPALDKQYGG